MALYVKAFSLVLKTVSKPMAKSLKSFIVSQPELKKDVHFLGAENQRHVFVHRVRSADTTKTSDDDGDG